MTAVISYWVTEWLKCFFHTIWLRQIFLAFDVPYMDAASLQEVFTVPGHSILGSCGSSCSTKTDWCIRPLILLELVPRHLGSDESSQLSPWSSPPSNKNRYRWQLYHLRVTDSSDLEPSVSDALSCASFAVAVTVMSLQCPAEQCLGWGCLYPDGWRAGYGLAGIVHYMFPCMTSLGVRACCRTGRYTTRHANGINHNCFR